LKRLALALVLLALAGCGGDGDDAEPGGGTTGPATTETQPDDDY
jgi:hypothetical protein